MKFSSPVKSLSRLASFVNQSHAGVIRLDLAGSRLTLSTAIPGQFAVSATGDVNAQRDGSVVLALDTLRRVLAALSDEVVFDLSDQGLELTAGRSRYTLKAYDLNLNPAPSYERYRKAPSVSIESSALSLGLASVTPWSALVSKDHPVLESVFFDNEEGHLRLVACDGYGLAFMEMSVGFPDAYPIIVPSNVIAEVRKRLPTTGIVTLAWDRGFYVSTDNADNVMTEMAGPIIKGDFPAYRTLTPPEFSSRAEFDRVELTAAIKRVCAVTAADTKTTLICQFGPDALSMELIGVEEGESAEVILPSRFEGPGGRVCFVPRNFAEALRCTATDKVSINFDAPNRVVQMESVGDDSVRHYLMPVVFEKRPVA